MTANSRRTAAALAAVLLLAVAPDARVLQRDGAPPARIVSLVPAVTEMLFAIGAGQKLVAVSSFDTYPPEVRKLERVGALIDPDLEKILALKPELVVVYASQVDLQQQLERARIPVFAYRHERQGALAGITATIRELGGRTGHRAEAETVARSIESRIAAIRGMPRSGRPRTVIVFGRDETALRGMFASGGVGFLHEILIAAGGENVFGDVDRESLQVTTELILARRPEAIVELYGRELDAKEQEERRKAWAVLSSVPAVRNGRVYVIADESTVVPGPRITTALELLARALHPPGKE